MKKPHIWKGATFPVCSLATATQLAAEVTIWLSVQDEGKVHGYSFTTAGGKAVREREQKP